MNTNTEEQLNSELAQERSELNDIVRMLDHASGMIADSWEGDAARVFLDKLRDVTDEIREAGRGMKR